MLLPSLVQPSPQFASMVMAAASSPVLRQHPRAARSVPPALLAAASTLSRPAKPARMPAPRPTLPPPALQLAPCAPTEGGPPLTALLVQVCLLSAAPSLLAAQPHCSTLTGGHALPAIARGSLEPDTDGWRSKHASIPPPNVFQAPATQAPGFISSACLLCWSSTHQRALKP
jgi:hypothetical protein